MLVKAKRLGWNEDLTPEQQLDMDSYEHTSNELEGELEEFTIPATNQHSEIRVCLVGGQEADPSTVVPSVVDNAAVSHDDIRTKLAKAVKERFNSSGNSTDLSESAWVAEVYDKDFVYEHKSKYYRQKYKLDKKSGTVELLDYPYEVSKKTDYVAMNEDSCECGSTCNCSPCKAKHGKSKLSFRRRVVTKNESLGFNEAVVNAKKASKSKGSKGGANCGIGSGGFQQGNTCARGGVGSVKAAKPGAKVPKTQFEREAKAAREKANTEIAIKKTYGTKTVQEAVNKVLKGGTGSGAAKAKTKGRKPIEGTKKEVTSELKKATAARKSIESKLKVAKDKLKSDAGVSAIETRLAKVKAEKLALKESRAKSIAKGKALAGAKRQMEGQISKSKSDASIKKFQETASKVKEKPMAPASVVSKLISGSAKVNDGGYRGHDEFSKSLVP